MARVFTSPAARRRFLPVLLSAAVVVGASQLLRPALSAAGEGRAIPAPAIDEPASGATSEVAVLAGGCFWGVQGVFQHVDGVTNAVSGYAGGDRASADYEIVSSGTTGHAESVRVSFDPNKITYGRILQIYFSVAHDPTQLNRQGPDMGQQYRSAIFPTSAEQAAVAKAYISQLDQSHTSAIQKDRGWGAGHPPISPVKSFEAAIVTRIEPDRAFYPAESYHQDFLTLHPAYPYIVINDLPKLTELKRLFPDLYRAEPVLVSQAGVMN